MDPKLPLTLPPLPPPSSSHTSSSYTSFPILAIAILGILTTAILLLSYYIFVTKCCLHWRLPNRLLFFHRRSLRHPSTPLTATTTHHHPIKTQYGLDLPTINSIPIFRFKANPTTTPTVTECAVCLSEFQHQQILRLLPNCSHSFHVDCIDTWLQSNDNCPLCRAQIQPYLTSTIIPPPPPPPPRSTEAVVEIGSPVRVWSKMRRESRGDEWIDTREKVQPIRRSFSMNSCNDRQLYVSVQEILWRNPGLFGEERNGEGSSSSSNGGGGGGSGRIRRSFFSFGRSSTRSASVLPV